MAERIPDEALVVRGGLCTPEQIDEGMRDRHPSGVIGASVQSAAGMTLEELARVLRNGQVGVTTVGVIRATGGEVIRTAGLGHHATVTGLTPEQLSHLLTPTIANPAKRRKGGKSK
jgi:hypothetical protein